MPSLICTHESTFHVSSLRVAANVSLQSMPSFCEKPHATNLALYPKMFPSTVWWNYKLLFRYRYCILDIILLEPFFLVTSSCLEGSASMMSLHSSYYSSSWTIVTCSSEQFSSFFACRWLYTIFPTSQMNLYG